MNIKPLGDRVLLKAKPKNAATQSGIQLIEKIDEVTYAEVMAVGYVTSLKAGDTVLFEEHNAYRVNVLGEPHFLIKEIDVLAVVV